MKPPAALTLDHWMPATDDLVEIRRARTVLTSCVVLLTVMTVLTVVYVFVRPPVFVGLNLVVIASVLAAFPVLRRHGPSAAAQLCAFGAWLGLTPSIVVSGGAEARFLLWYAVIPVFVGLLGGQRVGRTWGWICYLTVVVFLALKGAGVALPMWVPNDGPVLVWLANISMIFLALGGFTSQFQQQTQRAEAMWAEAQEVALREEGRRARAEALLETHERHQAEQQALADRLQQARDDAVAANEAKSRFLANMSHELRTPLNAILGYTEMVGEELDPVAQAECVEDLRRVTQAGRHLLELIHDVLDLARIEAGRMEVSLEEVPLAPLLTEVHATIAPLAAARGLRLEVDPEEGLPAVRSDRLRLRQILVNLLGNAVKFTDTGGVTVWVGQKAGRAVFRVTDTGPGIAADRLDALFEAFQMGDASSTRRAEGSGLGLTISRHYARLLGGDIEVESEVGRGSTFQLWLPAGDGSSASCPRRATA